jgi:uncharacterized membrane protein YhiD involved in acid resistance
VTLPIDSTLLADLGGFWENTLDFLERLDGTSDFSGDVGGAPNHRILIRLLVACVIGRLIGLVYRWTFTGKQLGTTLPDTHMLLCLGGALIWSVVGDNVARAFGLAGMVGLIRYRTVVRDPKDTTLLLFSMMLGMACGLEQYAVAIIGTMTVLFALAFLHYSHRREMARTSKDTKSLMQLMEGGEEDEDSFD